MPRSISSWATRIGPWQGWARAPRLARAVIKDVSDPTARSKSSVGTLATHPAVFLGSRTSQPVGGCPAVRRVGTVCLSPKRFSQGLPETCLHGLNAVWCDEIWCGVDPRGDKPSTAGPFDPDCEWLAYSVDAGRGERDYRDVFAEPLPCVSAVLHGSCTVGELDRNCPDRD